MTEKNNLEFDQAFEAGISFVTTMLNEQLLNEPQDSIDKTKLIQFIQKVTKPKEINTNG